MGDGMQLTVEQKVVHDELVRGKADTEVSREMGDGNGDCIRVLVALPVTTGAAVNAEYNSCDKCGYIYMWLD